MADQIAQNAEPEKAEGNAAKQPDSGQGNPQPAQGAEGNQSARPGDEGSESSGTAGKAGNSTGQPAGSSTATETLGATGGASQVTRTLTPSSGTSQNEPSSSLNPASQVAPPGSAPVSSSLQSPMTSAFGSSPLTGFGGTTTVFSPFQSIGSNQMAPTGFGPSVGLSMNAGPMMMSQPTGIGVNGLGGMSLSSGTQTFINFDSSTFGSRFESRVETVTKASTSQNTDYIQRNIIATNDKSPPPSVPVHINPTNDSGDSFEKTKVEADLTAYWQNIIGSHASVLSAVSAGYNAYKTEVIELSLSIPLVDMLTGKNSSIKLMDMRVLSTDVRSDIERRVSESIKSDDTDERTNYDFYSELMTQDARDERALHAPYANGFYSLRAPGSPGETVVSFREAKETSEVATKYFALATDSASRVLVSAWPEFNHVGTLGLALLTSNNYKIAPDDENNPNDQGELWQDAGMVVIAKEVNSGSYAISMGDRPADSELLRVAVHDLRPIEHNTSVHNMATFIKDVSILNSAIYGSTYNVSGDRYHEYISNNDNKKSIASESEYLNLSTNYREFLNSYGFDTLDGIALGIATGNGASDGYPFYESILEGAPSLSIQEHFNYFSAGGIYKNNQMPLPSSRNLEGDWSRFAGAIAMVNLKAAENGEKTLYLTFRGTDGDIGIDGEAGTSDGQIRYYRQLMPIIDMVRNYIDKNADIANLVVSGHSLGGTMADLFTVIDSGRFSPIVNLSVVAIASAGIDTEFFSKWRAMGGEFNSAVVNIDGAGDLTLSTPGYYYSISNSEDFVGRPWTINFEKVGIKTEGGNSVLWNNVHLSGADIILKNPDIDQYELAKLKGTGEYYAVGSTHGGTLVERTIPTYESLFYAQHNEELYEKNILSVFSAAEAAKLDSIVGWSIICGDGTAINTNDVGSGALPGESYIDRADLHSWGLSINDDLNGTSDRDLIVGKEGDDFLVGNSGGDVLSGGAGADTFVYRSSSDSHADGSSFDIITDYEKGVDKINFFGQKLTLIPSATFVGSGTQGISSTIAGLAANSPDQTVTCFTDGTDGYVYVKATGTAFDGTFIKLIGLNSEIGANDIVGVNHLPTLTNVSKSISASGSSGLLATDFTSGFSDPDSDALSAIKIVSLPQLGGLELNGQSVTAGQEIAAAEISGLSYTPSESGNDSFIWSASDGVMFSEHRSQFSIVIASNAKPTITDISEKSFSGLYWFNSHQFINAYSDTDGDSLYKIKIVELPSEGFLDFLGQSVFPGQEILLSEISKMNYFPPGGGGFNGVQSFKWAATDGDGHEFSVPHDFILHFSSLYTPMTQQSYGWGYPYSVTTPDVAVSEHGERSLVTYVINVSPFVQPYLCAEIRGYGQDGNEYDVKNFITVNDRNFNTDSFGFVKSLHVTDAVNSRFIVSWAQESYYARMIANYSYVDGVDVRDVGMSFPLFRVIDGEGNFITDPIVVRQQHNLSIDVASLYTSGSLELSDKFVVVTDSAGFLSDYHYASGAINSGVQAKIYSMEGMSSGGDIFISNGHDVQVQASMQGGFYIGYTEVNELQKTDLYINKYDSVGSMIKSTKIASEYGLHYDISSLSEGFSVAWDGSDTVSGSKHVGIARYNGDGIEVYNYTLSDNASNARISDINQNWSAVSYFSNNGIMNIFYIDSRGTQAAHWNWNSLQAVGMDFEMDTFMDGSLLMTQKFDQGSNHYALARHFSPRLCSSDPIVFDINNDSSFLNNINIDGVLFDILSNGEVSHINWFSPNDAVLAIDSDRNGQIQGMGELFADLSGKLTSTEVLATFDLNHDERIDDKDYVFRDLIVWSDRNSNGISEADEMRSIHDAGIISIDLHTTPSDVDPAILSHGTATMADGSSLNFAEVIFQEMPQVTDHHV
ncbi:lipase family protein [Paramagnetospirillum magneticum]|uniref:lipase family protein n=1 Tax=Paramagnetospirillum magneticum TaxID=84159 RepID=UPI00030DD721|nr:hypothetical protein [Paramagnetospirillum magneticum]